MQVQGLGNKNNRTLGVSPFRVDGNHKKEAGTARAMPQHLLGNCLEGCSLSSQGTARGDVCSKGLGTQLHRYSVLKESASARASFLRGGQQPGHCQHRQGIFTTTRPCAWSLHGRGPRHPLPPELAGRSGSWCSVHGGLLGDVPALTSGGSSLYVVPSCPEGSAQAREPAGLRRWNPGSLNDALRRRAWPGGRGEQANKDEIRGGAERRRPGRCTAQAPGVAGV